MKNEHAVRRLFAEYGLIVHAIRRNGHWQVKASRGKQPVCNFTVPVSPSDWRSMLNLKASLKRGYSRWATA